MKGHRWTDTPAVVVSKDTLTAFDSTDHNAIHNANRHNTKPIKTKLAPMRDYYQKTANVTRNNTHSTPTFRHSRGGIQRVARTPVEFNNFIDYIMQPITNKWHAQGTGYRLNGKESNRFIWADNILIIARNPTEAQ